MSATKIICFTCMGWTLLLHLPYVQIPCPALAYTGTGCEYSKYPFISEFNGKCVSARNKALDNGKVSVFNSSIDRFTTNRMSRPGTGLPRPNYHNNHRLRCQDCLLHGPQFHECKPKTVLCDDNYTFNTYRYIADYMTDGSTGLKDPSKRSVYSCLSAELVSRKKGKLERATLVRGCVYRSGAYAVIKRPPKGAVYEYDCYKCNTDNCNVGTRNYTPVAQKNNRKYRSAYFGQKKSEICNFDHF